MEKTLEGKWTAEAFGFLRLFRRTGRSLVGLLFLQAGWFLYLLLLLRLIGNQRAPLSLGIPWPTGSGGQIFAIIDVPIAPVYVVGGLLLLLGWILYSGVYRYLYVPGALVVRVIISFACVAAIVAVILANIPLLVFTWPLQRILALRLRKRALAQLEEERGEPVEGAPGVGEDREIRRKLLQWALEQVPVKSWALARTWGRDLLSTLARIQSSGRIGLAHLVSYSYEEDLKAAKAPLQIFSLATSRVETQLQRLGAESWITFVVLPPHFEVSTPGRAEFLRRLFGLDVLLWGSYLSMDNDEIWLNIQQRPVEQRRSRGEDAKGFRTVEKRDDIFPVSLVVDVPAVSLTQDDPWEAYTVLLVAAMMVLQNRSNWIDRGSLPHSSWYLFRSSEFIDQVVMSLVYEVFLSMSDCGLPKGFLPSAQALLTQIVGKWIGHQLQTSYDMGSRRRRGDQFLSQLHKFAIKCTKLMPDTPECLYRLGAIECLLGRESDALLTLKKAAELDAARGQVDPTAAYVEAVMEIPTVVSLDSFQSARFAAHVARVISTGDKCTCELLRKDMDESFWAQIHSQPGREDVAFSVINRMLEDAME